MSDERTIELLEAAKVGRDAAFLTACVLLRHPDPEAAIAVCEMMSRLAPVTHDNELDVAAIGAQAIREAMQA